MVKTYKGTITELPENGIFVFGSNTQGRHGKGAALVAKQKFGAIYGNPRALQGKSYAIITKDLTKTVHPSISRDFICIQIALLYDYAIKNANKDFYVAYSFPSINLNGYSSSEMAGMFFLNGDIPENIIFEEGFGQLILTFKEK